MDGMEMKGSIYRIKEVAFDLLSMEEELGGADEDSWELLQRYLRLKSTLLYIDLNGVISIARDEQKRILTDLVNKFFYYMEELGNAAKNRSIPMTRVCYSDATLVLQEVVSALMPPH